MNRSADNQVSDGIRQSGRTLQAGDHHAVAQASASDQLSEDPTGRPRTRRTLTHNSGRSPAVLRTTIAPELGFGTKRPPVQNSDTPPKSRDTCDLRGMTFLGRPLIKAK